MILVSSCLLCLITAYVLTKSLFSGFKFEFVVPSPARWLTVDFTSPFRVGLFELCQ